MIKSNLPWNQMVHVQGFNTSTFYALEIITL